MLNLMCLDPVTYATTKEELAYISKYLNKDTKLIVDGIKEGPYTIQCEYDEAMAQPAVIKLCQKAESEGIQGIFVNCFGDPGVRAAREVVKIPVFGGFEPVMNIALGVGDKIAILTVIRKIAGLYAEKIPIIALTANVFHDDIVRAMESGMNDYMTKPINMSDVEKTLKKWLS